MNDEMKRRGLDYKRQLRCDGIQGCFVGVKFKRADDNDDYDEGIEKKDQSIDVVDFLKKENADLKKQIEVLQKALYNSNFIVNDNYDSDDDDDIVITKYIFSKPKESKPKKTVTEDFKDIVEDMLNVL